LKQWVIFDFETASGVDELSKAVTKGNFN